ncbi:skp1-related protein-like [Harmonia axyridis]|uniref:skp1-related protein-like n=1 Tax=Harmonia axyridis TaxID=115357 RepID=UPI001E277390|nr:skp1-related protein-like [Harmonia axyridis]
MTTNMNNKEMKIIRNDSRNDEEEKSPNNILIYLKSADGAVFRVPAKILRCSNTLNSMFEHSDQKDELDVIKLPLINANILQLIICWAKRHHSDPIISDELDEMRSQALRDENEFRFEDLHTIVGLCRAANYLDIKRLFNVTCKIIASLISGKSPQELKKMFDFIRQD